MKMLTASGKRGRRATTSRGSNTSGGGDLRATDGTSPQARQQAAPQWGLAMGPWRLELPQRRRRRRAPPQRRRPWGQLTNFAGGAEGGDEGPRSKHRRGQDPIDSGQAEAAVQDTRRALELHHDQAVLVAAGATSQDFIRLAAEQHVRRLEAVVNAALARGVQPIADDGQDLQMLAPEDLKKWVATHLGEDPYW